MCTVVSKGKKDSLPPPPQERRLKWASLDKTGQSKPGLYIFPSHVYSLTSGVRANGYSVATDSGILIIQPKSGRVSAFFMFHFLFAKYAAVFSSRKQRGPPRCPWTPFCTSPGPAGLQMRNINQHSVCLQSSPVTLSFKIFREHARSSWFPAKHLKWPHSGDGWAKLSTHPSSTWKTCFGEVSFPWYFSPEGSDLCLFSVAFPVPDSVMFPSEPVKFPFLELFQVEEGFYNHDTPDDKWIRFSASAFDLASNGRRAREHLRAKGPILKNWAHILSLPGIISLLLKYLFHASLGCFVPCFQLCILNQSWKSEVEATPKTCGSQGVQRRPASSADCECGHCPPPGPFLPQVITSHCPWSGGNVPEWWNGQWRSQKGWEGGETEFMDRDTARS